MTGRPNGITPWSLWGTNWTFTCTGNSIQSSFAQYWLSS